MLIEKNTEHQAKLVAKIAKEMDERKSVSVVEEEEAVAAGSTIRNGKKTYYR